MADRRLTILQINDTHGYVEPHPELFWEGGGVPAYRSAGGFARLATVFRQAREQNPGGVLALDNGDTFHGTYPVVASRGEVLVPLLSALGLDAMTAHWDFAYGPERLRHLTGQLPYPLLALNGYDRESGAPAFEASRVLERGGVRVGVLGIAATIIDKTMPAHFSEGLRFTLGRDELPGHIRRLREEEGVEVVVVLSHLGFPQDLKLASEVAGIDVLLSGHTHNRTFKPARVGETLVIQSGSHGSFVGRLDLEVEKSGHVRKAAHSLIPVDDAFAPDPEMQALVEDAIAPHRARLAEVVGETRVLLHRNTIFESPMDDLLLAAVAGAAGVGVAFSNGWRYGAPVPPGPITENDLWNMVPPDPPVSLTEMTGEQMRAMMEENLERTFSCDPYAQMGGYVKRCRGVTLCVKLENPAGERVQEFFVGNAPLDPAATYTVAFLTDQGVPRRFGTNRRDLPVRAVEALRTYLGRRDGGPVTGDEFPRTVIAV